MKSITINVNPVVDTSNLPFVMSETLRVFFQEELAAVSDHKRDRCQIIFPETIKNGSLLSFVRFEPN